MSKLPLYDRDMEQCILNCLLMWPDHLIPDIDLNPDEFYLQSHQIIYEAIKEMHASGRGIDSLLLTEYLNENGLLGASGGAQYIAALTDCVDHPQHLKFYIESVRDKYKRRQLERACEKALGNIEGPEVANIIAELDSDCTAIINSDSTGDACSAEEAVRLWQQEQENPASTLRTGVAQLDDILDGGFRPGQLIVVGARPGQGKSALVLQMAMSQAEPSLFISLEMSRIELGGRIANGYGLNNESAVILRDNVTELNKIVTSIRQHKRNDGIALAVVDYLQLVDHPNSKEVRERQVADISRTLKRLAMELEIPIVAACQLNRASEKDARAPRLSDLRESGAIEQDANVVVMLERQESDARCYVIKNRNGRTGMCDLSFRPEECRFTSHIETGDFFNE